MTWHYNVRPRYMNHDAMTPLCRQRRYYIEMSYELLALAARGGCDQRPVRVVLPLPEGGSGPWTMSVEQAARGAMESALHLLSDAPFTRADAYLKPVIDTLGPAAQRTINAWHDCENHYAQQRRRAEVAS